MDRHIFSRDAVKRAASALVDRCHVQLDLDGDGAVVVTLSSAEAAPPEDELRRPAGELGNLLVADLAERKLDAQSRAARNLLLARALDGALPRGRAPEGGGQ